MLVINHMAQWLVLKGLLELRLVVGNMLVFTKDCLMNFYLFFLGEVEGRLFSRHHF